MKFLCTLAAGVAVACFGLSQTLAQSDESPTEANSTVQKWEYRVMRIDSRQPEEAGRTGRARGNAEEVLNELGAEGWELVAVRLDNTTPAAAPIFYFKRPKE